MSEGPPRFPGCRMVRAIGRGAYGWVWLAQTDVGAWRAVKIVRREEFADPRPFDREREGVRRFEPVSRGHPGLVPILRVESDPDDRWFGYVMELADDAGIATAPVPAEPCDEGRFLKGYQPATLRRLMDRPGRIPARLCLELGRKLADALAYLHARGLIHRDIKPSNVIFIGGEPRLADAGLVAEIEDPRSEVGTQRYAPDLGAGTPSGDCYSLGKVLHEAATAGRTAVHEAPTGWDGWEDRETFLELQEVVFRACDPEPARRYVSGEEMHRDLRRILAGESLRQLRTTQSRVRAFRRATLAALMVTVGIAVAWAYATAKNRELERLERTGRAHLARLHVSNGRRAQTDGAWHEAALWFAHALETTRDPDEAAALRQRIGALHGLAPRLAAIGRHEAPIRHVAFSPDGRWFASGAEDGVVQLSRAAPEPNSVRGIRPGSATDLPAHASPAGAQQTHRLVHASTVISLDFSPDSSLLAAATQGGHVRVWEVATGQADGPGLLHGGELIQVVFSPDGRRLVSAGRDGDARIWDRGGGWRCTLRLPHKGAVNSVAFSREGAWLLTASEDGRARVWEVDSGAPRFGPLEHPDTVQCASFAPDDPILLTACGDGFVRFWDMRTGAPARAELRHPHLRHAAFSPDGRRILTTAEAPGTPAEVRVWNAGTGREIGMAIRHNDRVRFATFSPDSRQIATAGHDGVVHLAPVGTTVEGVRLVHPDRVWSVAFSPDGRWLLTGGRDPVWRLWELGSFDILSLAEAANRTALTIASSPDGRWVAAANLIVSELVRRRPDGPVVERFSLPQGEQVLCFDQTSTHGFFAEGSTGQVRRLDGLTAVGPAMISKSGPFFLATFHPDGQRLLTAVFDDEVRLWDRLEGSPVGNALLVPVPAIQGIEISPDGSRAAIRTGASDSVGSIILAEMDHGSPVGEARRLPGACTAARFRPQGDLLAVAHLTSGTAPSSVLLLDPVHGHEKSHSLPHPDGVRCLDFTHDGQHLASGDEGGVVRIWAIPSGRFLRSLPRQRLGIVTVSFSPDNRHLAVGTTDGLAAIWDTVTGEHLTPPMWQGGPVWATQFAPSGRSVVVAAAGGGIRFLPFVPAAEPVASLRRRSEIESGSELTSQGIMRLLTLDELEERWSRRSSGDPP